MTTQVSDETVIKKFLATQKSAKNRGLPFNLSLLSISNIMNAKYCYYSGISLDRKRNPLINEHYLTIDRIDPKKGYVKGNVVACSVFANNLKQKYERDDDDFDISFFKKECKHTWKSGWSIANIETAYRFFLAFYDHKNAHRAVEHFLNSFGLGIVGRERVIKMSEETLDKNLKGFKTSLDTKFLNKENKY